MSREGGNNLFETVKNELVNTVNNLSLDSNFEEIKEKVGELFSLLTIANRSCPQLLESNIESSKLNNRDNYKDTRTTILDQQTESNSDSKGYPLQRKLKGGILETNLGDIFVPEKEIRLNSWTHGDFIKVTLNTSHGVNSYEKVGDSQTENENNRGEFDYCIVSNEKVGKNFVVSEHISAGEKKLIKVNGLPMKFLINDADCDNFNLEPGKLITIAYHLNDPSAHRVAWCHNEKSEAYIKPKPAGHYKNLTTDKNISDIDECEKKSVAGKNILVIGGDFKILEFSELATQWSFNLKILTGKEQSERITAAIKKNDMVFVASGHLNHSSTEQAREICKENKVPMRLIQSSLSGLKNGIKDSLKSPEVLVANLH